MEKTPSPSPRSSSMFFAHALREHLALLEQQLLEAYDMAETCASLPRSWGSPLRRREVAAEAIWRAPPAAAPPALRLPQVTPRSGTGNSSNEGSGIHPCLGPVEEEEVEGAEVRTSTVRSSVCFQIHPKCNLDDEELELLQAPFVFSKPSSRPLSNHSMGTPSATRAARPSPSPSKESWPQCLVHPDSRKRLLWDCLACFMLLSYAVVVPLEVFHFEVTPPLMTAMLSVRSAWLLFWLSDILMTFRTAVYVNGELCTEWSKIARKYATSRLLFDLTFVGLDIWSIACLVQYRPILRVAAIGKFLFMARGLFSFRVHKLWQLTENLSTSYKVCRLLALLVVSVVLAVHFLACLWFFCGNVEDGWVFAEELLLETWDVQYIRSVQWALSRLPAASMSSNMALRTGLERGLALLATFGALAGGSVSVSVITNFMGRLERSRQNKKKLLRAASSYIHRHALSVEHLNEVKLLMQREEMRQENRDSIKLLKDLPENFRQELFCEARGKILSAVPFYQEIQEDTAAETSLCSIAVSELFLLPKDEVFRANVKSQGLFLVSGCSYSVLGPEIRPGLGSALTTTLASLKPIPWRPWHRLGHFLRKKWHRAVAPGEEHRHGFRVKVSLDEAMSEQALWIKAWQHQGTLRAMTNGAGVFLETKSFYQVLTDHPDRMFKAVLHARSFVERMNACLSTGDACTDLPLAALY